MVLGLPIINKKDEICEGCILWKGAYIDCHFRKTHGELELLWNLCMPIFGDHLEHHP